MPEGDDLAETAETVRLRRARTGMSQQELGKVAGVGRSTVQKIERAEGVRLKSLIRVMSALDDAERRARGDRSAQHQRISIDEFLAQDPNLDDETRAHFRNQYELLTGLTRLRRGGPARRPPEPWEEPSGYDTPEERVIRETAEYSPADRAHASFMPGDDTDRPGQRPRVDRGVPPRPRRP